MIDVVLFDLDDTLFEHRRAVDSGIRDVLGTLGTPLGSLKRETVRWHELEETHYHRYLAGELDYQGQRRARARAFTEPYDLTLDDAAADAWFAAYGDRYRAAFRLHDDALPCLDSLRRRRPGIRFGIITNGDLAFQTAKLAALGVGDRFEVLVTSGEVGTTKPDPRIFGIACSRMQTTPDRAAYVGDRLRTDAIGATKAGLTGVWLNRSGVPAADLDADEAHRLGVATIESLEGVTNALLPETAA